MKIRTQIKIVTLLILLSFWLLLCWFVSFLLFTDYHFDKYDNMVALLVSGLCIFYAYLLVKYFKVVSLRGDLVKIYYLIPFFNKTYRFSDIENIRVKFVRYGSGLPEKKLIVEFSDKKKISISDFYISNFENIENAIDWILNNRTENLDRMPPDYQKQHSLERLEFDKSQANNKIFISVVVLSMVSALAIFSLQKMIRGLQNTNGEIWTIYLWFPIGGFLVWNIIKQIKIKRNIKTSAKQV